MHSRGARKRVAETRNTKRREETTGEGDARAAARERERVKEEGGGEGREVGRNTKTLSITGNFSRGIARDFGDSQSPRERRAL